MDIFDLLADDGPSPMDDTESNINPWDVDLDVLTTKSFPSTTTYRGSMHYSGRSCECSGTERHRSFFDFNKAVVKPNLLQGKEIPAGIKVCWNAQNIFEMFLPRTIIKHWIAGGRMQVSQLKVVGDLELVLRRTTYWYNRAAYIDGSIKNGLTDLGRQFLILFAGKTSNNHWHNKAGELRGHAIGKTAIHRLRTILSTIDGILMQICLCYPGEDHLSWDWVDKVTHALLRNLVPDYIRPGNNTDTESSFEKIKRIRKSVKESGFHITKDVNDIIIPRELSFFRRLLKPISDGKTPLDLYRISLLCQTRAAGVPPRTVYTKTKEKLVRILRTPPNEEVYQKTRPYIKIGMEKIHARICAGKSQGELKSLFSRCLNAAKVSLSDSAEMFTTTDSGGKLERAREVLSELGAIDEIDLETGEKTGNVLTSMADTEGEMLFHWALGHFHLENPKATYDSNVMSVRLSLVSEMGKFRGISVSHLAHAMALHVFSHVGLEYLKLIPSSESGVGAANHAWNFFKRMSQTNPRGEFVLGDEDVFLFSTDWETATDFMESKVTASILNHLCEVLGIPTWYRKVIICALTQPRQVEFYDNDHLLQRFFTGRGTLMGDPGTKVVLHLYHLVCREAALIDTQLHSGVPIP